MSEDSELDRLFEHLSLNRVTRPALSVEHDGLVEKVVSNLGYKRFKMGGHYGRPLTFNDCFTYQYRSKKRGFEEIYFNRGIDLPEEFYIYRSDLSKHIHRVHGPAYINHPHGVEIWIRNGVVDRADGPAITHSGNQLWVRNGYIHRLDGPAIDTRFCRKRYWINGQELSPKDFKKEIERRIKKGQYNEKCIKKI